MFRKGFTLLEVLIFIGIFSIVIVAFMTIFVTVSLIQARQSSAVEVTSQSQFILQTVQYYVERSSVIEMAANSATTTLRLRMPSAAEDPVTIQLNGTGITLRAGTSTTQNLTSNKVNISNLSFVKHENPPGHDSVSVVFTAQYNSSNPKQAFLQSLNFSVARVSAATFDSDVVASSSNTYSLGNAAGNWKSINNTVYFSGSNVGIGISSPQTTLQVNGGDLYIGSAGQGFILKASNGTTCLKVTASTTAGSAVLTSVTCP